LPPGRERTRCRAREGTRPSGRQAVQHPPRRGRARLSRRLRPDQASRGEGRSGGRRSLGRDARIPCPRANRGPTSRRGRRRLLVAALGAVTLATVAAVATAFLLGGGDATPAVVPDSLVKVDLESGKIVDVVPVGRITSGLRIVGRYVFAASEGDGTLTRVDTRTGAVVNSGKFDASGGLAAEGAKRVWVASVRRRQATLVDAALPLVQAGDPISSSLVRLPRNTTWAVLK